jgi:hypothetical protein
VVSVSATQFTGPHTLPALQTSGVVQLPQEATVRLVPQLSAAVTAPQFLPSRLQKAVFVSAAHAHAFVALHVAGGVHVPQTATVRDAPQLSFAVTLPQALPSRLQKAASLSAAHVVTPPLPPTPPEPAATPADPPFCAPPEPATTVPPPSPPPPLTAPPDPATFPAPPEPAVTTSLTASPPLPQPTATNDPKRQTFSVRCRDMGTVLSEMRTSLYGQIPRPATVSFTHIVVNFGLCLHSAPATAPQRARP